MKLDEGELEEPWETLGEVQSLKQSMKTSTSKSAIESDVTRFDYKRGEVYLNATLKTTVGAVLENTPSLAGWEVTVPLLGGTFTL